MTRLFTFCFLFALTFSNAQDTIYLDRDYNETIVKNASYFRVDDRNAPGEQDLIRSSYRINGEIYRQRSFLEKGEKLTLHGVQKTWYDNGQLFYTETYKKGKRHGNLIAFWEDGSKRRHDHFKKGKLKSGTVWNRQGEEIEHFPVMVPASFPGGQEAMEAYLRATLPLPEAQKKGTTVKVRVRIRISKDGYIDKIDVIDGAPHWYNAVTTNTLLRMPRWNPGSFMGDPINVWFTLPVTFRK